MIWLSVWVSQEKEIEITNEYIFALGAHVLYWGSKDLANFVLNEISKVGRLNRQS
jgi:hypothetical protein